MPDIETLSHTTWDCKYHVVFIPTYRRRLLLDSRVVDLLMAYNPTFVMLSFVKPLFFNSLKNGSCPSRLRIMLRDLLRPVCVVPISRFSALATCFPPLVQVS